MWSVFWFDRDPSYALTGAAKRPIGVALVVNRLIPEDYFRFQGEVCRGSVTDFVRDMAEGQKVRFVTPAGEIVLRRDY